MGLLYTSKHRKATWLELFFDLIFVVLIGKITHILGHVENGRIELDYMIKFILMFMPVWWIWTNHTLYLNFYDDDSKITRLFTLIIMLFIIVLSIFVDTDFEKNYVGFIIFYSAIRLFISLLYVISIKRHKEFGTYTKTVAYIYLINTILGFSSLLFSSLFRFVVVYMSIILDLVLPMIFTRKKMSIIIHKEHLIERTGLLAIILLGESVISLTSSISGIEWNISNIIAALSGFVLIGIIWWIYFDSFELLLESKKIHRPYIIILPQLLVYIGLAVVANVIRFGILHNLNIQQYRILALLGIDLLFLGQQIPYLLLCDTVRKSFLKRFITLIVLCTISIMLPREEYILLGFVCSAFIYVIIKNVLYKNYN